MNLKDLSIKRKLMLITMLTSGVAVVLSSAGFLIYDLISFRNSLSQDLMTQADIIGYNSAAAMAFKDEASATVTLSALQAKQDIVSAVLYTRERPPATSSCPSAGKRLSFSSKLSGSLSRRRSKRGTPRNSISAVGHAPMEFAGQTICKHLLEFRADLRLLCTPRVFEAPEIDFRAHFAPRRHDENGFRHKKLRSSSHQILRRRNRKADRRVQYDVVRNSTSGYGIAPRQR